MVTTRSMRGVEEPASSVSEPGSDYGAARQTATPAAEGTPAPENDDAMRTYRGNCHCKAYVYEVKMHVIKSALECNCSICHKKGYLWVFPKGGSFELVKGSAADLTQYAFGPKTMIHKFCPTCATPLMCTSHDDTSMGLNARAMQGIDPWTLQKNPHDGAATGAKYLEPEHKGPLPQSIDGHRLYTGSCHCGSVTLALMSRPLDETCPYVTAECNCSICGRNGYRWIYPDSKRVVLFARNLDDIGRYSFARHVLNKTFCRVCGVCMTNEYNNSLTEKERKALGALPARGFASSMKQLHPLNLRVFPDVDLTKLPAPEQRDGAKIISPKYVDP